MERVLSWPMVKRKRSNLESSRAAARQRRKLRSAAEAEALAKSTRRDDDPDRISELPDSVLHHILSFLDMKHVIHTAFLSKRWTTIFKLLPTLSLNQSSYETMRHGNDIDDDIHDVKFIDFVDKVLGLREAVADADNNIIRSLCISCFDKKMDTMNHVNTWIDFAVRHDVQELDFELSLKGYLYDDLLPIPDHPLSLFSCKLLTTLTLGSNDSGVMIPCDLFVDLPKLKTLHLKSLCFNGDKINENFFSRCLVLETLIITNCKLENDTLSIVVLEDHQLKYLKINSLHKLHKYLGIDQLFHITISAPKLTSLSIRDNDEIFGDYNLVNVHSLVEARMISYEVDSRNQMKFLNGISHVKSLSLSVAAVGNRACLKDLLNPFHNLRMLKLLMNTSFERNEICGIAYLLRKCPNVETLALKMSTEHPHELGTIVDNECGKADVSSLQFKFRSDHLKFIEIRGFTGCPNQLEFLMFMLMLTPVLEKMFIFAQKKHLTSRNKERCRAMLNGSPRASSKTEFFFLHSFKYEPMYGVRYWM